MSPLIPRIPGKLKNFGCLLYCCCSYYSHPTCCCFSIKLSTPIWHQS